MIRATASLASESLKTGQAQAKGSSTLILTPPVSSLPLLSQVSSIPPGECRVDGYIGRNQQLSGGAESMETNWV